MRHPLRLALTGFTLLALAACSSTTPTADLTGAHGTTVQSIRGETPGASPLRPESGNIWSDGLVPAAPRP